MSAPTVGPDRLLAVLRQHADDNGIAAPGRDILMRETAYSATAVTTHLRRLRDEGQIAFVAGANRYRPARYKIVNP